MRRYVVQMRGPRGLGVEAHDVWAYSAADAKTQAEIMWPGQAVVSVRPHTIQWEP